MSPGSSSLHERYRSALATSGFSVDPAQDAAIAHLERLRLELYSFEAESAPKKMVRRWVSSQPVAAPKGVYLWGSVGRGKTWIMDLFFESAPAESKRRSHFHRFMQGVHEGLRAHRDEVDPLAAVASDIAARARLICLDELFVSDIADAMLLAGLFTHLVDRGVTLVFTSNVPPSGLYKNGLQRQRFLLAIALIERHCEVVCIDGGTDYRLRQLTRAPIYLQTCSAGVDQALADIFEDLADGAGQSGGNLEIEGRSIPVIRQSENVVWLDSLALCEGPRSQNDYVSIAREYQSVILSGVPVFTRDREDAARRFIALIDEFYDRRVKLVISASAAPLDLYRGERLQFEFERTASRLIEMQSEDYLASAHFG
ncbi:MAG: AFG1 family ATPase [Gammaproteobacteria bacterium]|nr:AFG1 family ATPase [Gammaproteobacteria bacterium]